jgi:hypothetical protein
MGATTERISRMSLESEIAAYERMKGDLERHHQGKFVVIKDGELIGAFDNFENAAVEAVRRFGRGPYLIRQVGGPPPSVPISWLHQVAAQ